MPNLYKKPAWEVADILRQFRGRYQSSHVTPLAQQRLMNHIEACRTAALGGHMEKCDSCGFEKPSYNSCRDRHCPKCQTLAKEKWLEARRSELLPVNYFHMVFTLPHELNPMILANKRVMLKILFKSVSDTLLSFGKSPEGRLKGKIGFSLVLHSWNQKLLDHFHLHCVIPAGALLSDKKTWVSAPSQKFLFSVKALAKVFRGKFIDGVRNAFESSELILSGPLSDYNHRQYFSGFLETLGAKDWVVYSKAPFGGPEKVLEYLGRYTHRVAISNHRILNVTGDKVDFSYRDPGDPAKKKIMSVAGEEFIRRFLLHAIPRGFMRIRHYGFLSSRGKEKDLENCRAALGLKENREPAKKISAEEFLKKLTGVDILKCPCCFIGKMIKMTLDTGLIPYRNTS